MKILILGTGFVGAALSRHMTAAGHDVSNLTHSDCSLTDFSPKQFSAWVDRLEPEAVINTMGMKDLRECDNKREDAQEVNGESIFFLAHACDSMKVDFVHISSDHVTAEPITWYAISKLIGEYHLTASEFNALIIRTGHVYDNDCPWVQWLDGELKAGRTVEAWTDIVARPTYARNLAGMILDLLQRKVTGTVNCVSHELVNRLQLFQRYAEIMGYDPLLVRTFKGPCPSPFHIRKLYCECTFKGGVHVDSITEGFTYMMLERMRASDATAAIMAFKPENPHA